MWSVIALERFHVMAASTSHVTTLTEGTLSGMEFGVRLR